MEFTCSSGYCDWPSFSTLGLCVACTDVSTELSVACADISDLCSDPINCYNSHALTCSYDFPSRGEVLDEYMFGNGITTMNTSYSWTGSWITGSPFENVSVKVNQRLPLLAQLASLRLP